MLQASYTDEPRIDAHSFTFLRRNKWTTATSKTLSHVSLTDHQRSSLTEKYGHKLVKTVLTRLRVDRRGTFRGFDAALDKSAFSTRYGGSNIARIADQDELCKLAGKEAPPATSQPPARCHLRSRPRKAAIGVFVPALPAAGGGSREVEISSALIGVGTLPPNMAQLGDSSGSASEEEVVLFTEEEEADEIELQLCKFLCTSARGTATSLYWGDLGCTRSAITKKMAHADT